MDDRIRQALANDLTIDNTTIGRKSGQPRRIEIWFHYLGENEVYITGSPGKRDWYANLLVNPDFMFHFKGSVQANLPATATPITDKAQRHDLITRIRRKLGRGLDDLDQMVASSPLVRVTFKEG